MFKQNTINIGVHDALGWIPKEGPLTTFGEEPPEPEALPWASWEPEPCGQIFLEGPDGAIWGLDHMNRLQP